MPELAEVALYARDLNNATKNKIVTKVSFPNQKNWGRIIVPPTQQKLLRSLVGQKISFRSDGKALFLVSKKNPVIEFRLGMTGQFRKDNTDPKWSKHCFLILETANTKIYYFDPRRFGRIKLPQHSIHTIGGYSEKVGFWAKKKITPPHGFLDKARIAWLLVSGDKTGVGNYMANEALGRLGLSPFVPCQNEKEAIQILKKCAQVALASIRQGGNSFGTGYFQLNATEGRYARYCRYYQNPKVPRKVFKGRPIFTHF